MLTHWDRVTHICVSKLTIIGSDNGLSPGRRQAIIWTNAGILLIGPVGTNFSEILIEIDTFSFIKMHLKMLSGERRPFCLCLNVLKELGKMWHDDVMTWKCFPQYWPFVREPPLTDGFPSQRASNVQLWCFLCLNKLFNKGPSCKDLLYHDAHVT